MAGGTKVLVTWGSQGDLGFEGGSWVDPSPPPPTATGEWTASKEDACSLGGGVRTSQPVNGGEVWIPPADLTSNPARPPVPRGNPTGVSVGGMEGGERRIKNLRKQTIPPCPTTGFLQPDQGGGGGSSTPFDLQLPTRGSQCIGLVGGQGGGDEGCFIKGASGGRKGTTLQI